ncbi:MATE family efflux transporter [Flavonifractor plautii]|nr:MATE family efflux transporter [Flavonifractor plautii]
MTNRLDRDFHLPGLLRFALPTIIMMLVVSLYTIVDGVLIARLVGENALAAANVAYPAISFTLAMGIMLGTGGSAVVAHKMGAGYLEEARRDFGFLALVAVCIGLAVCLTGFSSPGRWPGCWGQRSAAGRYGHLSAGAALLCTHGHAPAPL